VQVKKIVCLHFASRKKKEDFWSLICQKSKEASRIREIEPVHMLCQADWLTIFQKKKSSLHHNENYSIDDRHVYAPLSQVPHLYNEN